MVVKVFVKVVVKFVLRFVVGRGIIFVVKKGVVVLGINFIFIIWIVCIVKCCIK